MHFMLSENGEILNQKLKKNQQQVAFFFHVANDSTNGFRGCVVGARPSVMSNDADKRLTNSHLVEQKRSNASNRGITDVPLSHKNRVPQIGTMAPKRRKSGCVETDIGAPSSNTNALGAIATSEVDSNIVEGIDRAVILRPL